MNGEHSSRIEASQAAKGLVRLRIQAKKTDTRTA